MYVCTHIYKCINFYICKSFSTTLDKGLRKNIKGKEKEELEKLENISEMKWEH